MGAIKRFLGLEDDDVVEPYSLYVHADEVNAETVQLTDLLNSDLEAMNSNLSSPESCRKDKVQA